MCSGGAISARTRPASVAVERRYAEKRLAATTASATSAARSHPIGGSDEVAGCAGVSLSRVRSSSSMSRAVCQRSSGSFDSARATM